MPPLLLDDDEAVAIAVGLRTAAGASVTGIEETSVRALVKLEQVLPAHLRRRVNALQTATVTPAASGGPTVDPEALTAIAGACRDRERAALRLPRPRRRPRPAGCVEPHTLVNLGRRWYLVAWDCDRERLAHLPRRPPRRASRPPARASSRASCPVTTRRPSWRRTSRARRRATRPASPCSPRSSRCRALALRRATVEEIDEHTCELRTSDDSLDWLAVRVAMLGVDFEVHEPPELVERVRELAARLERATGAGTG